MAEFISEYSIFLAKTVTILIFIFALLIGVIAIAGRGREVMKEKLDIIPLNEKYDHMAEAIKEKILNKDELKKSHKETKQAKKAAEKKSRQTTVEPRKRIYVLDFDGDIKASAVTALREEVTAILTVATDRDEVFVRLQSGGGLVHAYGLAASQLLRLRQNNIPLTIAVDKIAASGGYMMACVADKILAAPFAVIGSIGVIAQIPNFHKLLKRHDIDFEQLTAGEFKRTLTMFGENTDKAREKFREELEDTHLLFKEFITEHRPQVEINRIATGEHWPATRAVNLQLVDELKTSDDYLLEQRRNADLYEIKYSLKRPLGARLGWFIKSTLERVFTEQNFKY